MLFETAGTDFPVDWVDARRMYLNEYLSVAGYRLRRILIEVQDILLPVLRGL